MTPSKEMQEALNGQVNAELYSAYLYLSMSAWFESENLPGFAHWMREQAKEETGHAMRIFEHLVAREGRVVLGAVEQPPTEWDSPLAAFETVFQHEQKVSGMIDGLVNMAASEKDHATNNFLQWFVEEQVEEEATASQAVQKLRMVGEMPGGLFMLDREMAQRGAE